MSKKKQNATGRPSIGQVAKEAGVSKSSVSNVLSGNRKTGELTRIKVLKAVKKLNYQPHFAAQILGRRRTMNIGVIVRDISDQYCPLHLKAIDAASAQRGYRITPTIVGDDLNKMRDCIDTFSNGQADGVIILTSMVPDQMIVDLCKREYPVVTPMRSVPGHENICDVQIEIEAVFRQLLDYLYDLGHREFGFIAGIPSEMPQRCEQFHKFITERGLSFSKKREIVGVHAFEEAESAACDLLGSSPEITAIVCANDVIAIGTMAAAHELKLSVPADIAITGFDDIPISKYCTPPLTTIRMPIAELSNISLNRLVDRIEAKDLLPTARLKPELIIRGSSGLVRVS